jgi:hypothetical protein
LPLPDPAPWTGSDESGAIITPRGLGSALVVVGLYVSGAVGFIAATIYAARLLHQDGDVVFTFSLGIAALVIGVATFRDAQRKRTMPRGYLSPTSTTIIYAAAGLGLLALAISRAKGLAAAETECRALVAAAPDSHARLAALKRAPSHHIPALVEPVYPFTCGTVLARRKP